ncbi:hypothetical protein JNUCC64_22110 [Streptomyces sp. JNUCC 64]
MESWREDAQPGQTHDPNEVTVQMDGLGRQLGELKAAAASPGEASPDGPVFVDETGRRSRLYRRIGMAVVTGCAVYACVIVATVVSGNSSAPWLPVPETQAEPAGKVKPSPRPEESASARPSASTSADPSPSDTAVTESAPARDTTPVTGGSRAPVTGGGAGTATAEESAEAPGPGEPSRTASAPGRSTAPALPTRIPPSGGPDADPGATEGPASTPPTTPGSPSAPPTDASPPPAGDDGQPLAAPEDAP